MIEAGEQHFIEQFVTHPPVKTLDERTLRWLFRGRIMPVNLGVPAPFERRIRGQLSAIIADDHAGLAAHGDQIGQFAYHSFAADRGIRNCCHTLARHIIDQVEHSEPAATRQLVVHEVEVPAPVGKCRN